MGITKPRIHVRFLPFPPYHLDPQPLLLGITRKPMKFNPVFLAVASSTANSTATRQHSSSHGQLFVLLSYKIQQHANHVTLIATMPTEASRLYTPSRHHASSLLLVALRHSRVTVCSLRIYMCYAGQGCKSGPAGFKTGQAFTAVYNRASRL